MWIYKSIIDDQVWIISDMLAHHLLGSSVKDQCDHVEDSLIKEVD